MTALAPCRLEPNSAFKPSATTQVKSTKAPAITLIALRKNACMLADIAATDCPINSTPKPMRCHASTATSATRRIASPNPPAALTSRPNIATRYPAPTINAPTPVVISAVLSIPSAPVRENVAITAAPIAATYGPAKTAAAMPELYAMTSMFSTTAVITGNSMVSAFMPISAAANSPVPIA